MIVISTDLIVSGTVAALNAPAIGYHNVVTTSNVATTTENASYPATNLANPATFLEWRGTALAQEDITVTPSGETIDYVGLARHNFGTAGIQVTIQGDTGSGYATVAGPFAPADDSPIMLKFASAIYTGVRIRLSAGSVVPRLAVAYVGHLLEVPRNLYVGHTPINYGRRAKVVNGRSETGHFLGRIVISEHVETSVDLQYLSPSWYRSYFDPFVIAAKEQPFFFAWRPYSYPAEVGYAWLTDDPIPVNQLANGMMQVQMSLMGAT